jgi:hypothetical protein
MSIYTDSDVKTGSNDDHMIHYKGKIGNITLRTSKVNQGIIWLQ